MSPKSVLKTGIPVLNSKPKPGFKIDENRFSKSLKLPKIGQIWPKFMKYFSKNVANIKYICHFAITEVKNIGNLGKICPNFDHFWSSNFIASDLLLKVKPVLKPVFKIPKP